MSVHSFLLSVYKKSKGLPFVGPVSRYAVGRLKSMFAAWHYSENRLRAEFPEFASENAPAPAPLSSDQAEVRRLSVRVERLERGSGAGAAPDRLSLFVTDAAGVRAEADWDVTSDPGRLAPMGGASRLEIMDPQGRVDATWFAREGVTRLAGAVAPGGELSVSWIDPVRAARSSTSDEAAAAALVRCWGPCRHPPVIDGRGLAEAMAAGGFVLSPVEYVGERSVLRGTLS